VGVGVAGAAAGVGVGAGVAGGAAGVAVGSGSRGAVGVDGVGDAAGKPAVGDGGATVGSASAVDGGAIVGSSAVMPPPCKTAVGCDIAVGRGAAAGVERPPQPANTITNITINHANRLILIVPVHVSTIIENLIPMSSR